MRTKATAEAVFNVQDCLPTSDNKLKFISKRDGLCRSNVLQELSSNPQKQNKDWSFFFLLSNWKDLDHGLKPAYPEESMQGSTDILEWEESADMDFEKKKCDNEHEIQFSWWVLFHA